MKHRQHLLGPRFLKRQALAVFAAVTLFTICTPAKDVSSQSPGEDPSATLADLADRGFIGGANDTSDVAVKTRSLFNTNIAPILPERQIQALEALSMLQASLDQLRPAAQRNELENRLADGMKRVELQLVGAEEIGPYSLPENWKLNKNKLTITIRSNDVLNFEATYLTPNCGDPSAPECVHAFSNAVVVLRHTELVHRLLDYARRDAALSPVGKVADLRLKQWEQYFDKGFPQWPWELYANGIFYRNEIEGKQGLLAPPSWQLIFAHPEIALEYISAADDGSQFEPALMIELLGFNAWSWNDKGKQEGPGWFPIPLGAGLVTTYSDRAGTDDWGWGGVLHLSHTYNIGVTLHDGDVGYFVSANVSKLYDKALEQKRKWFGGK